MVRTALRALAATLLATVSFATPAAQIEPALAASLAMRPVGAVRVLIHWRDAPSLEAMAAALGRDAPAARPGRLATLLRERFAPRAGAALERLRALGAQDLQVLWLVDAVAAEMPRSKVREVAAWPEVDRIEVDIPLRAQQTPRALVRPRDPGAADAAASAALAQAARQPRALPDPAVAQGVPEHIAAMDLPRAWQAGFDGRGTTVAVIDSGVDLRAPGLAAAWRGGTADWFDPYAEHRLPHDGQGHGTLVASLLVGGRVDGMPIALAPQARFIAARLFDDAGQGRLSAVYRVYQWLLDPDGRADTADAPQVVNNSWGFAQTTDRCDLKLVRVWQAFRLAGVPVVFAAGNDGPSPRTSMSPANNPGVIAVGALDAGGALARQSSRGPSACQDPASGQPLPFPTLVAPGVALPTLDRIGGGMGVPNRSDGTSFASALASGALLLLRQAQPEADVPSLLATLARHASPAVGGRLPMLQVAAAIVTTQAAAQRPAQRLVLMPAEGRVRVDAAALAPALPRGARLQSIALVEAADALSVSAQEATALDWRPAGATPLRLRAALDDGTTLPLELVAGEVAAAATAALPTHVFSGRRGKPLTIDLAALAGTETEAAALQWSRPLRGGRLERAEGGTLRYRPPGNFVGTDQFALRSPTLGELTVKVMVLP